MHAAPRPEVQTAVRKEIQHREILSDLQRMVHRKQTYGGTEPHALGSLRRCGEKELRVRQHAAEIAEVMLGSPQGVEAQRFGGVDLFKPMGVELGTLAIQLRYIRIEKIVAEFHEYEISLSFILVSKVNGL